jgi:DsbC/DsbD-like thiol-disulfide interchange protein
MMLKALVPLSFCADVCLLLQAQFAWAHPGKGVGAG